MINFNKHLKHQLLKIEIILASKEDEYAKGRNRLHNFHIAAKLQSNTPEESLLGMMTKHIVSVVDLLQSPESATKELADEKLLDLVNYSLLAHYMIHNRIEQSQINPIGKHVQSHSHSIPPPADKDFDSNIHGLSGMEDC